MKRVRVYMVEMSVIKHFMFYSGSKNDRNMSLDKNSGHHNTNKMTGMPSEDTARPENLTSLVTVWLYA